MKTKRFSLGVKIASILASISILSVGFAAWLIVGTPDDKSADVGSFTVYAPELRAAEFGEITAQNAEIIFGKAGEANQGGWLIDEDNTMEQDNLTATISFKVFTKDGDDDAANNPALKNVLSNVSVVFAPTDASKLNAAIAGKDGQSYVAAPTVAWTIDSTSAAIKSGTVTYNTDSSNAAINISLAGVDESEITVTLTVTFAWGSLTGGANPYVYYNGEGKSYKADGQEAFELLDAVFNNLNGNKYSISLSAEGVSN